MRRKMIAPALLLVTTVAALAMGKREDVPNIPTGDADTCGAAGYASLMGQNIAAITLPAELLHRVIAPGQPVTQDYRPMRINFDHDGSGNIVRIWCG